MQDSPVGEMSLVQSVFLRYSSKSSGGVGCGVSVALLAAVAALFETEDTLLPRTTLLAGSVLGAAAMSSMEAVGAVAACSDAEQPAPVTGYFPGDGETAMGRDEPEGKDGESASSGGDDASWVKEDESDGMGAEMGGTGKDAEGASGAVGGGDGGEACDVRCSSQSDRGEGGGMSEASSMLELAERRGAGE